MCITYFLRKTHFIVCMYTGTYYVVTFPSNTSLIIDHYMLDFELYENHIIFKGSMFILQYICISKRISV